MASIRAALTTIGLAAATAAATTPVNAPPAVAAPADCDTNGVISVMDALAAAQADVGILNLSSMATVACDIDQDGIVTILDSLAASCISVQITAVPPLALSIGRAPVSAGELGIIPIAFRLASTRGGRATVRFEFSLDGGVNWAAATLARPAYAAAAVAADTLTDVTVSPIGDVTVTAYWDSIRDVAAQTRATFDSTMVRLVVNDRTDGTAEAMGTFGPFVLGNDAPAVFVSSPQNYGVYGGPIEMRFGVMDAQGGAVALLIEASRDFGATYQFSTEPKNGQQAFTVPGGASGGLGAGPVLVGAGIGVPNFYSFFWDAGADLGRGAPVSGLVFRVTPRATVTVTELSSSTAPVLLDSVVAQDTTEAYSGFFTYDPSI